MRLIFCTFTFLLLNGINARKPTFFRAYECAQGRCQRTARPVESRGQLTITQHPSLQACRLVCSTAAGLWPLPTGKINTGLNYLSVSPSSFQFMYVSSLDDEARGIISHATDLFVKNLHATCGPYCQTSERKVTVHLKVESSDVSLNWDTNESYGLDLSSAGSDITAIIETQTVYGARHGLETLSQLVAPTPTFNGTGTELVVLDTASVQDKPVFRHRGLLIDTARNFVPVPDILRMIDALASVKMNTLHWHATDSQSWPLEIKSTPLMSVFGAYGPDKIYSVEDMQMVVKYAKFRGVRVIMEIDSPSHAGAGWEWGPDENLGNLAVCVNRQPWRSYCIQPPCGQLNPVNPNTLHVLRRIYRDLLKIFGRSGMVHLGGDELYINCWNATEEITIEMRKMGLGQTTQDFLSIWSDLHKKQLQMLDEETEDRSTDKVVLWSSQLTEPEMIEKYLNKSKFIIQTWVEANKDLNKKLLDLGYNLIVSTKDTWYLDHGFWGGTKYHTWRDAYLNRIPQHPGVLGGEACMWGEYIFGEVLDSRVWPRTAAVAERLWSDPPKITTGEAEPRLQAHIARMRWRRILVDAIAPEWCNQHEGQCL